MIISVTEYITLVVFIAFWCTGLVIASEDGKILAPVKHLVMWTCARIASAMIFGNMEPKERKVRSAALGEYFLSPIIGCIWCMASLHTAMILVSYQLHAKGALNYFDIVNWLCLAVPAVVLNGTVYNLVQLLRFFVRLVEKRLEGRDH